MSTEKRAENLPQLTTKEKAGDGCGDPAGNFVRAFAGASAPLSLRE